jgi:hypothetical protein
MLTLWYILVAAVFIYALCSGLMGPWNGQSW